MEPVRDFMLDHFIAEPQNDYLTEDQALRSLVGGIALLFFSHSRLDYTAAGMFLVGAGTCKKPCVKIARVILIATIVQRVYRRATARKPPTPKPPTEMLPQEINTQNEKREPVAPPTRFIEFKDNGKTYTVIVNKTRTSAVVRTGGKTYSISLKKDPNIFRRKKRKIWKVVQKHL